MLEPKSRAFVYSLLGQFAQRLERSPDHTLYLPQRKMWCKVACGMAPEDRTRREYLTTWAVNPEDGKPCEVLVSYDRIQFMGRLGMGHTKECAELVPMILQRPTAIFEGLMRDVDDDRKGVGWRCYCGIPDYSYGADGEKSPRRRNQVFLIFLNRDGVAYNWRWEPAHPRDHGLPAEHVPTRFKRRLL
jgi:hypothetical protein